MKGIQVMMKKKTIFGGILILSIRGNGTALGQAEAMDTAGNIP